jgi:hypothetical protein
MARRHQRLKKATLVSRISTHQASQWIIRACGAGLLALCMALVTACGGGASLPAGVYTNQQFHFRITYPAGWQVNESQQPGAAAPLIVIITRSGARSISGSLISSLTIDVLTLSDVGGSQVTTQLAKDKTLTPVTLSGLAAYRDQPTRQQGAGNQSGSIVTHTDYYLVQGAYEYQLSLDALSGDESALDTMAQSFTIVS